MLIFSKGHSRTKKSPWLLQLWPNLSMHLDQLRLWLLNRSSSYHLQSIKQSAKITYWDSFICQVNSICLTIYKTLGNKFALGIYILNFLRCYIFTLCQLKDVLFPVISWSSIFAKRLKFLYLKLACSCSSQSFFLNISSFAIKSYKV